jgi:hypothetical protein
MTAKMSFIFFDCSAIPFIIFKMAIFWQCTIFSWGSQPESMFIALKKTGDARKYCLVFGKDRDKISEIAGEEVQCSCFGRDSQ